MNVILNFKTDKGLKNEAKKIAGQLGLPLGTILNHYLKNFVNEQRLVFENHPTPSKKVSDELAQISKDIKNKKNLSPAFSSTKEAIKWLEA